MKYFLLYFLLLFAGTTTAQNPKDPQISWSPARKLQLSDFRILKPGEKGPENLERNMAVTRTGFTYTISKITSGKHKDRYSVGIYTLMYPKNSFLRASVLNAGAANIAYLLNHEQKHFDISEIYARELSRFLRVTSFTKNYKAEILEAARKLFQQAEAFHEQYDKATNNGRIKERQEEWDELIAQKLKDTAPYRNKAFFLTVHF